MSRIGKLPVDIPAGVDVKKKNNVLLVKGKKGVLEKSFHPNIDISVKDGKILVSRPNDAKLNKSLHGLTRALISNMVVGVTTGFERKLQIVGVGYRVVMKGKDLVFSLGYSHPIEFKAIDGVAYEIGQKGELAVRGIDKELVGQVAANIRSLRKPEPYKGKGIRYFDEVIVKKAGKSGAK